MESSDILAFVIMALFLFVTGMVIFYYIRGIIDYKRNPGHLADDLKSFRLFGSRRTFFRFLGGILRRFLK